VAATLLLAPALVEGHTFGTQEWNENIGRELLGWHYDLFRGFAGYGRQDGEMDNFQPLGRRLQPAADGDEAPPAGDGDGDAEAAPAGDGDGEAVAGAGEGDAAADAPADDVAEGEAAAAAAAAPAAAGAPSATLEIPKLDIPCLKVVAFGITWVDAIEPCGPAVTIPGAGLNFTTPFGTYFVPGVDILDQELEKEDNAFSGYTGYVSGLLMIFYAGYNVSTPAKRAAVREKLNKMKNGAMPGDEIDPMLTPAEVAEAAAAKLDPDSATFVCPGNIYRLVCVMHPGEVGYKQWIQYCGKALVCAYMQFYLPYNILTNILKQWHFHGVKSPLYFGFNIASFFTQFTALANVCTLFAAKCTEVIEGDAQAVHFLRSHTEPAEERLKDEENAALMDKAALAGMLGQAINLKAAGGEENGAGGAEGGKLLEAGMATKVTPLLSDIAEVADRGADRQGREIAETALLGEAETEIAGKVTAIENLRVEVPTWILEGNEFFWCALNITLTCFSSVVLMLCMFLKVATFEGDIMNIAVVAVSLYFVFDLDDKVMQSDPKLRPRYRRIVLKQTEAVPNPPKWIKSVSLHTIELLNMAIPLGLMGIVLISWKGTDAKGAPIIIGGDPFKQPR
jgi:hypothetical protein